MRFRGLALTILLFGCASSAPEPEPVVVTESEPPPIAQMPAPVMTAPEPELAPAPIIIEEPEEAETPPLSRSLPVEPAEAPTARRPSRSLSLPPRPVLAEMPAAPVPVEPSRCESFAETNDLQSEMTCVSVLYGTNRTITDNPPDDIRSDRSDRKRTF